MMAPPDDDNPLLATGEMLAFDRIRPEHVTPALDQLLARAEAALERAVGPEVPPDYQALSAVLDVAVERLRVAWGAVNHLQSVADTPALRAAHGENLPRVTAFYTRLASDERLYAKYKAVAAAPEAAALGPARRRALEHALRDFVLGGAELQGEAKQRFAAIQERMAALSQRFGENVLDATDAFELIVDPARLDGLPPDALTAARAGAEAAGQPGMARITLQHPSALPVLLHAHDRDLREQVFRARATRASEFGPPERDNAPLMRELLQLRLEAAKLLGLASYAELSLVPKMAQTPQQVLDFVRDLAQRARPFAERERAGLEAFAAAELGLAPLQPWDRAYAAERLKERRYAFSETEVRSHLPAPKVLAGLFALIERLLGVRIREDEAPVWHDSVRFYRLWRDGATGEEPIAGFYLDLYARAGKQQGAWMDDARQRWRRPDTGALQTPMAHLVCNFAPPVGGRPALLTHDDVITLFHEFGHGLHHMLTQIDEPSVAGIAGVEWDACELPSQFMENFCWEHDVLPQLSAHVDSGEPLPSALFERMLAARHFHSGMMMLRHCQFALFDMRVHAETDAADRVQALATEVATECGVFPPASFDRFPNSFGHLFDGGYAAGYYSYAWAEVLSADAYSAFEEAGVFDPLTGQRWRETVLEVGGSRPALESFTAFRGREPRIDALLRHQGLIETEQRAVA